MANVEGSFVGGAIGSLAPAAAGPGGNGGDRPRKGMIESFGSFTFDKRAMARYLSKSVYEKLIDTIENNEQLDLEIADEVAHAMKEWAIALGATHFCHWFQPVRGMTAEKHDSFLSIDRSGLPIQRFSGRQLIQGEPDASSFPSGGMRSTFEARGYTAWDPTSPAFLLSAGKAATLVIPSVFLSFTGEVLDMKTPLLRALHAVENRAYKLIKLFGNRSAKHVRMTVGPEQEYFLVSKEFYDGRPDLICTGRTLFGAASAKHQQMEDHYFGSIKPQVLDFMADVEAALIEQGIPAKTRHNEVAPNQFELAPLYEEANLSVDHNLHAMEIMRKVADEHGLAILLHEKPYAGVNGNGKHLNWSLMDSEGNNLLEPGAAPKKNIQFLTFIAAILAGADKYGHLLRTAVADAGNDHRLGANEAPPAVMSVYLGEFLSRLIDEIEKGAKDTAKVREDIDSGLKRLPRIALDNSDRNRTAPIAFTGNKFEFRAVGGSQSCSEPAATTALIVAYGIDLVLDRLADRRSGDITEKALAVIKEIARETKRVRFEGNCYAADWHKDAAERGLPAAKDTPEALETLSARDTIALYERYHVLNEGELRAKKDIRLEAYSKTKEIELRLLKEMAMTGVVPALARQIHDLGRARQALVAANGPRRRLKDRLREAGSILEDLYAGTAAVDEVLGRSAAETDAMKRARLLAGEGVETLEALRGACDRAEGVVDHDLWPFPKYRGCSSSYNKHTQGPGLFVNLFDIGAGPLSVNLFPEHMPLGYCRVGVLLAWSVTAAWAGTPSEDGIIHYHRGRLKSAASSFEKAIQASPDDPRPYLDAAILYRDIEKHGRAQELFASAAEFRPTDPDIQAALGWAALRTGDGQTARGAFHAALKVQAKHEMALLGLARLDMDSAKPRAALKTLESLLEAHPHNAVARVLSGRAHEALKELPAAIDAFTEALTADPTYSETRLMLARVYNRLGRSDQAWRQYSKVLNVDPRHRFARKEARRLRKRITRRPDEIIPPRRIKRHLPVVRALARRMMPAIGVAIGTTAGGNPAAKKAVAFVCSGRFAVLDPENGRRLTTGPADKAWVARRRPSGRSYELVDEKGRRRLTFQRVIAVRPLDPERDTTIFQRLSLADGTAWEAQGDRQLKGTVEIRAQGQRGLYLVNRLPLEDYVYGVINEEMPAKFPTEALKAQAVIARNHAIYSKDVLRKHRRYGYDLCDGQHCQVYSGVSGETRKGRAAVDATRGLVLRYKERLAQTPYSSNCGGHTQGGGEVRGWADVAYLRGRKDVRDARAERKSPWELELWLKGRPKVYCNVPELMHPAHFRWSRLISANELGDRIRLRTKRFGLLRQVRVLRRSKSGNVNRVLFRGTRGRYVLDRENRIRGIFGLGSVRSTMFTIETERDRKGIPTEFYLHGGGWGHGVGLCQYGAAGRALDAQTFREILEHYYPGTHLAELGY
ncbi:MAG: glutamine synthetase III [Elusimicrobiota bacterium]